MGEQTKFYLNLPQPLFSLFSLFHHFFKKVFWDYKKKNILILNIHYKNLFKKNSEKSEKTDCLSIHPPNPFTSLYPIYSFKFIRTYHLYTIMYLLEDLIEDLEKHIIQIKLELIEIEKRVGDLRDHLNELII